MGIKEIYISFAFSCLYLDHVGHINKYAAMARLALVPREKPSVSVYKLI